MLCQEANMQGQSHEAPEATVFGTALQSLRPSDPGQQQTAPAFCSPAYSQACGC
jgi:hypothetical protein